MYQYVENTAKLYGLLQDDLSRKLFWERLRCDIHPTLDNTFQIVRTAVGEARKSDTYWENIFHEVSASNKKLILYGPGELGKGMGQKILESGNDFLWILRKEFQKAHGRCFGKVGSVPTILAGSCGRVLHNDIYDELLWECI